MHDKFNHGTGALGLHRAADLVSAHLILPAGSAILRMAGCKLFALKLHHRFFYHSGSEAKRFSHFQIQLLKASSRVTSSLVVTVIWPSLSETDVILLKAFFSRSSIPFLSSSRPAPDSTSASKVYVCFSSSAFRSPLSMTCPGIRTV